MATNRKPPHPGLKWSGRVLGSLSALFWVLSTVLSGITEILRTRRIPSLEGSVLLLLVIFNSAAVGISWRKIRLGGLLVVAGGILLSIFAVITAGHNRIFAVLVSGFPFLVAGALLVLSAILGKESG